MPLQSGTTFGSYEITTPIGAGGMGEVYRARDTRLDRDVAIKVLPDAVSKDRDRLERFEREAKLLAQLNHPNIATIHGLEELGGQQLLVMELIEGDTLADRIERGPIPAEEAVPLFIQIAEGLEAAHEKGIVHRDLKPANVKITPEGKVKILDFGLAKAFAPESDVSAGTSQSPTLTKDTALGAVMGTASYMSPEQARAKSVDKRTDLWAFGCCLYEALTGHKAFGGETVSDIIGAVMRAEPELERVPSRFRRLVGRCLRKDPRERLRDVGDARLELVEPERDFEVTVPRSSFALVLPWVAAAMLAVVSLWLVSTDPPQPPSRRFTLSPPELMTFVPNFTLSPDGRYLVYVSRAGGEPHRLAVQDLEEGTVRALDGSEQARIPFVSPDGERIAFHAEGELRKVPFDGGPPLTIVSVPDVYGASWTATGDIIYGSANAGMFVVPEAGGDPRPLTTVAEGQLVGHRWPHVLAAQDAVLFSIWNVATQRSAIGWASLESGEVRELLPNGTGARVIEDRYLIYASDGFLRAVEFDAESAVVLGEPVALSENVFTGVDGMPSYALSEDGLLVYGASGRGLEMAEVVRVDRRGREEVLISELGAGFWQPALSPDGRRLAVVRQSREGTLADLRLFDLERHTLSSITAGTFGSWPMWTLDGERVVFAGATEGQWTLLSVPANGRGSVDALTPPLEIRQIPNSFSPSGVLAFERGPATGARDIWMFDPSRDPPTRSFLATEANERGAKFSPDGAWIAFTSDQSGRDEVYVAHASGEGDIVPISNDGGREPVWARDMSELFYRNGTRMMAVPLTLDDNLEVGVPELLFEGNYSYGWLDWAMNYDVSPDGAYFYMVRETRTGEPALEVVTHWTQELEAALP